VGIRGRASTDTVRQPQINARKFASIAAEIFLTQLAVKLQSLFNIRLLLERRDVFIYRSSWLSQNQPFATVQAMNHPLRVVAITRRSLRDESDVQKLVRLCLDHGDATAPIRFGSFEPLTKLFDGNISEVAKEIKNHVLFWASRSAFVQVAPHIEGYMYGSVSVDLSEDAFTDDQLKKFVDGLARFLVPDLAVVHLLNEHDRDLDIESDARVEAADEPAFGIYAKELEKAGIPNFYWGMVFGAPYIELFGLRKLLDAPCCAARRLSDETVVMELTTSVQDCIHKHGDVAAARALAKAYLGENAFWRSKNKTLGLRILDRIISRTIAPRLVP
jgi:hypothetical protein